ncbi:MAG: phosphoglucomutase [Treponema sp.]|nr:phosphoglucomutase [Treponema sp.]
MKTNMILSASGWRKVFAIGGQEQDKTSMIGEDNIAISIYAAKVFADYVKKQTGKEKPEILVGMDARPTGPAIAEAAIKTFVSENVNVKFAGITAAPEIMAFSRGSDGFMYISASHNPVGHNGIKFGLNAGGVLNGTENAKLVKEFTALCEQDEAQKKAFDLIQGIEEKKIAQIYEERPTNKAKALESYRAFLKWTISASEEEESQKRIFELLKKAASKKKISVVVDMNGSARADSVDEDFFAENGIGFYAIHNKAGEIAHEIIPEAENLIYVAQEMERLQKMGHSDAVLGYMPDCDGDRGNIVYWDDKEKKAVILKAQQVFSLSVLSELAYQNYLGKEKPCVVVNCPTSMRIEEIAGKFGAQVFRAEVGEANVVNLAAEKRAEGFDVRIFGEGSNGGTITYPSAVRDPINTVFAIIKLLNIKELYETWCKKSNCECKDNYTLTDILASLPAYTTTGVSDPRAVLHIETKDHGELKARFQKIFEKQWIEQKVFLENYGIFSYECDITNGTKEIRGETEFRKSGKGGLKIKFLGRTSTPVAFIWMRGSGTEPVFRIMCDVKGNNSEMEKALLCWETEMLREADKNQQ